MDHQAFDRLARTFSQSASRRRALGGLLGGALAAVAGTALGEANHRHQRHGGKKRHHHAQGADQHPGKQPASPEHGDAKRHHRHHQDQPTAAGPACRAEGHPCEGNQTCCANLVCTGGGKGAALRCAPCPNGTVIVNGACCTPATTCPTGQQCGAAPDGCGGKPLDCGGCTAPQTCGGGGVAGRCGCTPATKCPAGQNCGTAPDGCGSTINCGNCTGTDTCGGGGTANQCGCTKTTCAKAGKNCGSIDDGCGSTLQCGTCTAPKTCGGGGTPNVCGCTPTTTTCPAGQQCGSVPDGCGGSVNCGTCPAGQQCDAHGTCFCSPVGPDLIVPTNCNGTCVDTDTDPNNCGACGATCPANLACNVGQDNPKPGLPINNCCNLDNGPCTKDEDCCRCYDNSSDVERCICSESEGRCIMTEIG